MTSIRVGIFACLMAMAFAMTGCATPDTLTAQVTSHGLWPTDAGLKTYAFERLPSQMAQAEAQAKLEAAAAPVLASKGFKPASSEQADVWVQVATQSRRTTDYRQDNYPRIDTTVFGGVLGGHGGIGVGFNFDREYTRLQVDVLLRERRSGKVLYETHAENESLGGMDERLMPALFEAALKDFPAPAVSPRPVTVKRAVVP